jgi:mycofactocin precursor
MTQTPPDSPELDSEVDAANDAADAPAEAPETLVTEDLLVEEISIDGMCGVY